MRGRRRLPVAAALGFVGFTYAFQQTAVIPAIPTIEAYFHTSAAWSTWLLSGYLMVATAVTPAFGRLGDLFGSTRLLLIALVIFLVGSVGAALVPVLPATIAFRALQGFGGPVLPLSFAIARRHVSAEQASTAIAKVMGAFGVGATMGFATGGLMAQLVSWRLVFATGALTVAVGIALLLWTVPRLPGSAEGSFDVWGVAWLGGTSLFLLLGLTLGEQTGWGSPIPWSLFASALAVACLWTRTELHHRDPVIDLRVLRNRSVLAVNSATVGLGWARFAGLLLFPVLVRGRFGFAANATVAGLFLVPDGIGTIVGGPLAGRATQRWHPRLVFAAGLVLVSLSALMLVLGLLSRPVVLGAGFLLGLGSGIATQASSAVTTTDVPREAAAASSSLNSTVRRFSGGLGGQVSTVIVATSAASGAAGWRDALSLAFAVVGGLAVVGALVTVMAARGEGGRPSPTAA